jgi:hypothetical protein
MRDGADEQRESAPKFRSVRRSGRAKGENENKALTQSHGEESKVDRRGRRGEDPKEIMVVFGKF